jgi:hypothetical protein
MNHIRNGISMKKDKMQGGGHNHKTCHWPHKTICKKCSALIKNPTVVEFLMDSVALNKPDAQEDAEHMYRYMMQYPESSVPNTKCPRTIQLQHIGDSWTLIQGKMKRYLKRKETMKAAEGRLLKSRKVSIPALEIGTAATPEWYANFSDPRKLQPVNLEAQLIQEALEAQFGL